MKEVKYINEPTDLNNIIDNANQNVNYKNFFLKATIGSLVATLTFIGILTGTDVISTDLSTFLAYFGSCSLIEAYITGKVYLKKREKKNKRDDAICYLEDLSIALSKENVCVPTENLKETISNVQEITKMKTYDENNNLISKQEKIIKYFYLLDRDDQITVLKQIAHAEKFRKNEKEQFELYLLEENDMKDIEFPVVKTLKRK